MKLIQVEIHEFKSIKSAKIDIKTNQLCLVGKNECGKSSILQAISHLNIVDRELDFGHLNKSSKNYPRRGYPVIFGVFEVYKTEISAISKLVNKFVPKEAGAAFPLNIDHLKFQIKRWGNGLEHVALKFFDGKGFGLDLTGAFESQAQFYSEFFGSLYPRIEYFEDEDLLIEPATLDQLQGSDEKFETFRRLLYLGGCKDISTLQGDDYNHIATLQKDIGDQFTKLYRSHYRQDKSITITLVTVGNGVLTLVITDSTGKSFSIKERSPGFRYYFSFLVNKLYTKEIANGQHCIFLLDEPGSNLHPNGAKDLLKTFAHVAEKDQLFFTTHNPFLVIRNDLDSLIFVEKDPQAGTIVKNKPYLKKYQVLRKELGILLNDSFVLGDINLVVEGATEKFAFHRLFQLPEYNDLEWINIYDASGVNNVSQALNYLGPNSLGLSGIAFFDSDLEAMAERKKPVFAKASQDNWNWEFLEVNEAFSEKTERTFEDLFPPELYVAAFNRYGHKLNGVVNFATEFKPFDDLANLKAPIINQLTVHYKSFFAEEDRKTASITKQDVIRILFEMIDELNEKEAREALAQCRKVCDKILSLFRKIEKNVNHQA